MKTPSYRQQFGAYVRRIGQSLGRAFGRLKAYIGRQPGWRLALYGLGVPIVLAVFSLGLFVLLVWQGTFGPLPTYEELRNIRNLQASELISEDGVVLGRYYIENRVDAEVEEVAPYVIDALVATEDARFFEHRGIDLRAFMRVIVKSILLGDETAGGGSTLSQQLAKNIYGRRTYPFLEMPINKLREMMTARRLENLYTKDELLGMYLNTVPFGDNSFGIKIAARRYFNKAPSQLQVEEAAVLIGMLKAVTTYNPRKNPERSLQRRNVVLSQMVRNGHLEAAAGDSLMKLPLVLDFQAESHNEGLATYFREHIRQEVDEILKELRKPDGAIYNLYTDGLRLYTTIDSRMQSHAERAVRKRMPEIQQQFYTDWAKRKSLPWQKALDEAIRSSSRYHQLSDRGLDDTAIRETLSQPVRMTIFDWQSGALDTLLSPLDSIAFYTTLLQTGLLAIEPETGLIRAWVGGIDHRFVQYDHVKASRQIGSTMKPLVYATAIEQGMSPCEYHLNERLVYEQFASYSPSNSDGEYGGAYSMDGALSKSINTIAVKVGLQAGLPNVRALASRMGIEDDIPLVPSTALGAVEASLLEMVTVYSTFPNGGRRPSRLHYLDRIETADGTVVYQQDRPDPADFPRVLDRFTAQSMNYMLKNVVNGGTGSRLRSRFRIPTDVAGKTGTTQDQTDGWFMGYTPKLTVGVWVGAEQPSVHFRTLYRGQSSSTALPIWGEFVQAVYADERFADWRRRRLSVPADSTLAELQCPPSIPMIPEFFDLQEDRYADLAAFFQRFEGIHPDTIQLIIYNSRPRGHFESLDQYAERLLRRGERFYDFEEEENDDRTRRRRWWSRLLFGKKKDGGPTN